MRQQPPLALREAADFILGRPMTDREVDLSCKFLNLLIKWQKVHRLVGSGDREWIVENLILDSLLFAKILPSASRAILDLGSGAGIPGIPLAIVLEGTAVMLVESRQRRASFLAAAIRELGLENASVLRTHLDVETLPRELAGAFDAVVARCAGGPAEVIPLGLELVKAGGVVVVAGPPDARALPYGQWVTVPGVKLASTRRFAVVSRPRLGRL